MLDRGVHCLVDESEATWQVVGMLERDELTL
jgi:hypothetical protein